jgi:uncharacterized protein YndB with AHSA1/START domain
MSNAKTLDVAVERTILTSPSEAFDAWMNPEIPGNPWNLGEKLLWNPRLDGLFFWAIKGTPHYGRFTAVERPGRLEHTWMSPNTGGLESLVTVTFTPDGRNTHMRLVHSGLPETEGGRGHDRGWTFFLEGFADTFRMQPERVGSRSG